jgi:transposase
MGIDLSASAVTLDAGCDAQDTRDTSKNPQRPPVISPHRRQTTKPIRIAQQFRWFDRALSRERDKVERTFGWQDTYRTLVVSDDRLPDIRKSGRRLT